MSTLPSTQRSSAARIRVRIAASSAQSAQQLVAHLQAALGAPADWQWQACTYATLQDTRIAAQEAVLLLAPPLGASTGSAGDDQAQLMLARQRLVAQGQAFQLLFSQGPRLLDEALTALCNCFPTAPALQDRRAALSEHGNLARWNWTCDTCSDPDCERRLFQGLLTVQPG